MANPIHYYAPELLFNGYTFQKNTLLGINENGKILSLEENPSTYPENTQFVSGLIMPGLINAHCHLELSHLLGQIPQHTGLVPFVGAITEKMQNQKAAEIQLAISTALQAMKNAGIVAVGDICNTDAVASHTPVHGLRIHHFVECYGLHEHQSLERFMHGLSVFNTLSKKQPSSLVMHAPYSVSPSLIKLIADFNRNKISTIHHQESPAEHELFDNTTGNFLQLFERVKFNPANFPFAGERSTAAVLRWNDSAQHLILVHNTFSTQTDIDIAQQSRTPSFWCLCPKANLFIENALPNIPLFIENKLKMVLGTDSLASNTSLNLWEEMAVLQAQFPMLQNEMLLQWATANGAEALAMQTDLGSLEINKQPGILHLPEFKENMPIPANPEVRVLYTICSS